MAPVYTSAFTPPTTNKIGAMGAMVPAHISMTWHNSTGVGILQNAESCQGVICGKSCVQCYTNTSYHFSAFCSWKIMHFCGSQTTVCSHYKTCNWCTAAFGIPRSLLYVFFMVCFPENKVAL